MRSLAAATEQQLNEQLAVMVATHRRALDGRRDDVLAAISAAIAQDDHLHRVLPQWPALTARASWWTQWRVRRRITSSFRQLQFAVRRYDRALAELVRVAAGLVHAADHAVEEARSYSTSYDETYEVTVVEPPLLTEARRWAAGVLPGELCLRARRGS